jgi:hypothetical protein
MILEDIMVYRLRRECIAAGQGILAAPVADATTSGAEIVGVNLDLGVVVARYPRASRRSALDADYFTRVPSSDPRRATSLYGKAG